MSKKEKIFDLCNFKEIERSYRIEEDSKVRIKDHAPKIEHAKSKDLEKDAEQALVAGVAELQKQQEKLYASNTHSLLVVFQAMDAAGKDSTIKHVMTGVNPQGCQVYSFKQPSSEELDHNFLWRCSKALPERGRIGIFNRSHYEDVLITKVHPEIIRKSGFDDSKKLWEERYQDIRAFERHIDRNGTKVIKFFLNVSKAEQKKRFLSRLEDPSKHWKFSLADLAERSLWSDYMKAYEDALSETSTKQSPWYIVPADDKKVIQAIVVGIMAETLKSLKLSFPKPSREQVQELDQARKQLAAESNRAPTKAP